MDKDSIKQIIMRGQEVLTSRTYRRRELSIPFSEIFRLEKVIAIIGPRRVGKTYYLRQALNEMHARIQEAIFIDFSEIGSQQLQAEDFPLLLSCYFELFPDLTSPVFLLDEIQELAGFEPALKYLLNRQLRVIITGSNSRNLIPELASSLRGKVLSWNLMPLSFGEFLDFRQIEQERSNYTVAGRGRIFRAFSEYLEWGGFPEIVLSRDADLKTHLLSSYIDVMLFRDVVERHNVTNIPVLKELFLRILRSGTKGFSLNKCYNTLKSMGMRIGKDTLFLYLSYLEDSLFVLLIENQKNPRLLPKKVYLADTGLYQYLQPLSPDTGKLFENRVFLDLYMQGSAMQFYKDQKRETDIILTEKQEMIQIAEVLHEGNYQREIGGLSGDHPFTPQARRLITRDAEVPAGISIPDSIIHEPYMEFIERLRT